MQRRFSGIFFIRLFAPYAIFFLLVLCTILPVALLLETDFERTLVSYAPSLAAPEDATAVFLGPGSFYCADKRDMSDRQKLPIGRSKEQEQSNKANCCQDRPRSS